MHSILTNGTSHVSICENPRTCGLSVNPHATELDELTYGANRLRRRFCQLTAYSKTMRFISCAAPAATLGAQANLDMRKTRLISKAKGG